MKKLQFALRAVLLVALAVGSAWADPRIAPTQGDWVSIDISDPAGKLKYKTKSVHENTWNHATPGPGLDMAMVRLDAQSEQCNPNCPTVIRRPLIILRYTPFTLWVGGSSSRVVGVNCTWGSTGYECTAYASKTWEEKNIKESTMQLLVWYRSRLVVPKITTISGHDKRPDSIAQVVDDDEDPGDRIVQFHDNGTVCYDENGDPELDANGDPVWVTPPALQVEFTSSVSFTGDTATFTYTIENLTSEDRTFDIPEVTSPTFPTGWSGTVSANDEEELSFSVTGADTYEHRARITLSESDDGGVYRQTAGTYVTESRLSYNGTVSISSVTYDSVNDENDVAFVVSGQDATSAALWTLDDDGNRTLVDVVDGDYETGVTYTLSDPDYEPDATNIYMVQAGIEPNGYGSLAVEIQN